MTNDNNDNVVTKNPYIEELEKNCYKNIERVNFLKHATVFIFASLVIVLTIITGYHLINDARSYPMPANAAYINASGEECTNTAFVYVWDKDTDVIYNYILTDNKINLYPIEKPDGSHMTRSEIINKHQINTKN